MSDEPFAVMSRATKDDRVSSTTNCVSTKNALFAGSDGGGDNWAVIATLIDNSKLNGVEPFGYLNDVLTRIANGHLNSAIDELLPWAYAKSEPLKAVA